MTRGKVLSGMRHGQPWEGLDNPVDIGCHLDRVKTPAFFCSTGGRAGERGDLSHGFKLWKEKLAAGAGRTDETRWARVGILAPCDTPWIKVLGLLVREDQMLK